MTTLPRLLVAGTGGFAKEVAQLATTINRVAARWSAIEYVGRQGQDTAVSLPFGALAGTDSLWESINQQTDVVIGVGTPAIRARIATQLQRFALLNFPNLIHPAAQLDADGVILGVGNIVTFGAAFTCDIHVGDHNVFNLNCTIGHDCRIGSFNVFNPGSNISGGVHIGDACLLGTGSKVLENTKIVSSTTLGANGLLTRDALQPGIYVGSPAKLR